MELQEQPQVSLELQSAPPGLWAGPGATASNSWRALCPVLGAVWQWGTTGLSVLALVHPCAGGISRGLAKPPLQPLQQLHMEVVLAE